MGPLSDSRGVHASVRADLIVRTNFRVLVEMFLVLKSQNPKELSGLHLEKPRNYVADNPSD